MTSMLHVLLERLMQKRQIDVFQALHVLKIKPPQWFPGQQSESCEQPLPRGTQGAGGGGGAGGQYCGQLQEGRINKACGSQPLDVHAQSYVPQRNQPLTQRAAGSTSREKLGRKNTACSPNAGAVHHKLVVTFRGFVL